jgi:transcriptional regulator with XRE-family HTH domain
MATRQGVLVRARRIAADDEARLLTEIERGRRGAGLSISDLGRAAGLSRSATSRALAGRRPMSVRDYVTLGAFVGLDVRLRAFPAGDPIRDAGSQRLLARFRGELHPTLGWLTEVPLGVDGDLRAWDALISGLGWRCHVEAETVLDDIQALERRIERKRRDGRADHLVVVVADTHRNRRALAAAPAAFGGFSREARAVLRALRRGEDPGRDAIVMV